MADNDRSIENCYEINQIEIMDDLNMFLDDEEIKGDNTKDDVVKLKLKLLKYENEFHKLENSM